MARTTKYPSLYVFEEGETYEPVEIEDADWAVIEQVYGRSLPNTLRDEVFCCCNRYASSRHIELRLQSNAEAEKELGVMLQKLQPFIDFAFASGWHGTQKATASTRAVVADAWSNALAAQPFRIRAEKVWVMSKETSDLVPLDKAEGMQNAVIELDANILGEIAQSLAVAGKVAKQKFRSSEDGFVPRNALPVWMTEVRDAFDKFNKKNSMRLPIGAYASEGAKSSNNTAGPFSRLLFELHRRMPNAYRERILNGPDALAARLKRATRMRSKLGAVRDS
jgi:hypothetical protein